MSISARDTFWSTETSLQVEMVGFILGVSNNNFCCRHINSVLHTRKITLSSVADSGYCVERL